MSLSLHRSTLTQTRIRELFDLIGPHIKKRALPNSKFYLSHTRLSALTGIEMRLRGVTSSMAKVTL